MKAKALNKLLNIWHWLSRWWWLLLLVIVLLCSSLGYLRMVWKAHTPETVPKEVLIPTALEPMPKALEKLKIDEIVIAKKYDNEQIKVMLLPDSALQHWADSLFNTPAARGVRRYTKTP